MKMGGWLCPLCGCHERPSVCALCINAIMEERRRELKLLMQTRGHLRQRLDAELEKRRELERQRLWRREQEERCEKLRQSVRLAEASLHSGKAKLKEQREMVSSAERELAKAQLQLAGKKTELESLYLVLKAQTLSLAAVTSELAHVQRSTLRQLCSIFPLRLAVVDVPETWDGIQKLSQAVRICGVRLPEGDEPLSMPPAELAAALGYLLQFLALAAKYLSAPLLHNAGFAASSSRIWQRVSFWTPRAASFSHQYPLFLARAGSANAEREASIELANGPLSPSQQAVPLGASGHGNNQRGSLAGGGGSAALAANGNGGTDSRPLRKGITLLKRSIMCLCVYEEALLGLKLPRDLSPFSSLAKLMSWLTRDSRASGVLSRSRQFELSASSAHESLQSGPILFSDEGALSVGPPEELSSMQFQSIVHSDGLALPSDSAFIEQSLLRANPALISPENGLEEWDLVERPPLPPPPSRAEDVEHWTRAMFIDATK